MEKDQTDFYKKIRIDINKWAKTKTGKNYKWIEYVLLAPDLLHLLCKLAIDKDVPIEHKAKLAICIAYFVSPIDIIPESVVGPIGYVDDIALSAYVLNGIVNNINPEIITKHWSGEGDILGHIKSVLKAADDMVGKGLWKKLMQLIELKKRK